jgi:hypothetical protein
MRTRRNEVRAALFRRDSWKLRPCGPRTRTTPPAPLPDQPALRPIRDSVSAGFRGNERTQFFGRRLFTRSAKRRSRKQIPKSTSAGWCASRPPLVRKRPTRRNELTRAPSGNLSRATRRPGNTSWQVRCTERTFISRSPSQKKVSLCPLSLGPAQFQTPSPPRAISQSGGITARTAPEAECVRGSYAAESVRHRIVK